MSLKIHLILLLVAIAYSIAPLLIAWSGLGLANVFECQAYGIEFTCPNRPWLGQLLTCMTFAHWLSLFTVPTGFLAAIGLGISLLIRLFKQ